MALYTSYGSNLEQLAMKGLTDNFRSDLQSALRCYTFAISAAELQRTRQSTIGDWAFCVAAPRVWNDLPHTVTSSHILAIFRRRLRTHLYSQSYRNRL